MKKDHFLFFVVRRLGYMPYQRKPPSGLPVICMTRFSPLFRTMTEPCGGNTGIERDETLLLLLTDVIGWQHQRRTAPPQSIALARDRIDVWREAGRIVFVYYESTRFKLQQSR